MENEILELLKLNDKALSVYDIYDALNLKTTEDLKNLMKELNKLEDNLQIYRTKKDNYLLFQNCHLKVGTFIGNKKGFGFVDIDGDDDVHIAQANTNNAVHGDRVIVEITSQKGKDLDGRIVRIVDRKLDNMVGEYYVDKNGFGAIKLDNDKINIWI